MKLFLIAGFDPTSESWIEILIEAFSNIFIHYNWQFLEMLKDSKLSWDLIMMRMAKHAVKNIFGYLSSNDAPNLEDLDHKKAFYQGNLLKGLDR